MVKFHDMVVSEAPRESVTFSSWYGNIRHGLVMPIGKSYIVNLMLSMPVSSLCVFSLKYTLKIQHFII